MKKILMKFSCIAWLATVSNIALASNDNSIKVGMGFDQGFGVTAQFSDNINAFIGNDGLSADLILRKGHFSSDYPVSWYVGAGAAINWDHDNEYSARVPLGIALPFAKNWSAYGQAAPELKYRDKSSSHELKFGVDFAAGIRYTF